MVEDLNIHGPARLFQPLGKNPILFAGRRIAGRMIVYEDHGLGRVLDRQTEDFARMNERLIK